MIVKKKDGKFGEIAVLLTEDEDMKKVEATVRRLLSDHKYWIPREFLHDYFVPSLLYWCMAVSYTHLTSSLESNIGLNAIAHYAAKVYGSNVKMPQGLGTGQLFTRCV